MKDIGKNLIFWDSEVDIVIIWMWALMYNAIHVQVQVVKFWNLQMPQLSVTWWMQPLPKAHLRAFRKCTEVARPLWNLLHTNRQSKNIRTGYGFACTCNLLLPFFSVTQVSSTDCYFIQAVSGTSGLLPPSSHYLLHCKMKKQTKTTVFRKLSFL